MIVNGFRTQRLATPAAHPMHRSSQIHFDHVTDAIELPRVVRLGPSLYAGVFVLMKLLPAKNILTDAVATGALNPGDVVLETSSGTFGLGLAMVCNAIGHRLIVVTDPSMERQIRTRIEDLGGLVDVVTAVAPDGGYQRARLGRLDELRRENPRHFWPRQYDNPLNPVAYEPVARLLDESVGRLDCLVATVGSGGSACGTARALRKANPRLHLIGVDTHGSVAFGQPDAGDRLIRAIGGSIHPRNIDHSLFDEIHWVSAAEAFLATRTLHRNHALFMGATSGAAWLVADWYARRNPAANTVCLLPDEGHRYVDTVYCDDWLRSHGVPLADLPREPTVMMYPDVTPPTWTRFHWGRRTYREVTGRDIPREDAVPPPNQ